MTLYCLHQIWHSQQHSVLRILSHWRSIKSFSIVYNISVGSFNDPLHVESYYLLLFLFIQTDHISTHRLYDSLWPPSYSMKSNAFCLFLSAVCSIWYCLEHIGFSLPFNTQRIISMTIGFGNYTRLLSALYPVFSSKTIAISLTLPRCFILSSWPSVAHFFKHISIHYHPIHSTLMYLSNGRQFSNIATILAIVVLQHWGSSWSCVLLFCLQIIPWLIFSRNPPIHPLFHWVRALSLGWPIHLVKVFPEVSFCVTLKGAILWDFPSPTIQCTLYLHFIHYWKAPVIEAC